MQTEIQEIKSSWLLNAGICLVGWLICAGMCLTLTIMLEGIPEGYDAALIPMLVILFANIFVFIFTASHWENKSATLCAVVCGIITVECLILGLLYLWARSYNCP